MMEERLKLYVWRDVMFAYDEYTGRIASGVIFALAASLDEAKAIALSYANQWNEYALANALATEPEVHAEPFGMVV